MAYDSKAAHEYYINYTKKGLKKGRKKGKKKKTSTGSKIKKTSLLAWSSSGLNDTGKIQAALLKERITAEMNAALAKATTQEEKDAIRVQYSQRAHDEISKLKNDTKYAQPKKESVKTSSGGKSFGGSSSSKSSGGNSSTDKKKAEKKKKRKAKIKKIKDTIKGLEKALPDLPESQKSTTREIIKSLLSRLSALRG